jgi:hypothetical protein
MGEDLLRTTDARRWRLRTDQEGVHYWNYLSESAGVTERPQSFAELYFLGLPRVFIARTLSRMTLIWVAIQSTPYRSIECRRGAQRLVVLLAAPAGRRSLGVKLRRPLLHTSRDCFCSLHNQRDNLRRMGNRHDTMDLPSPK